MDDEFSRDREKMVEDQIAARGVADPKVLAAMAKDRRSPSPISWPT
jgi:protein-L-isoaspartate O-methyltransferase